jgi:peroxiredoxin
LQRWEQFRPRFEALGVTMVTVSPDTVEETARLRTRYGLGMVMLADPALQVIGLYGVRHEKGFAATPGRRGMLRPLAVPTALLVDEWGIVRWIDQTDDYRLRSDADRVVAAIAETLGPPRALR